jgi:hypothetical protein
MREYLWGAVLFAVLAGYTHYRAGWWLVRRDPDRRRGLTLALLHSGYGLLNGSLLGLIFVFLLLVGAMMDLDGGARAWILGIVAWCVLAVLSALVSAAGFLLAITRRQSIWLDSAPRSIVRSTQWPPTCAGENRVKTLAKRTAKLGGFVTMLALFVVLGGWLKQPGLEWLDYAVATLAALILAMLMGLHFYVAGRLEAAHPRDCWVS